MTPTSVKIPAPFRRPGGAAPDPSDEAAALRSVITVCGHLSALAAQGADLTGVAGRLHEYLAADVVILDRALDPLAFGAAPDSLILEFQRDQDGPVTSTVLAAVARTRRSISIPVADTPEGWLIAAPVMVGEEVAGYLVVKGDVTQRFGENLHLMVIEHAAMISGVVLGREVVVVAAAARAREQLVEGLLSARIEDRPEGERWARHLGLDATQPYCVVTMSVPPPHRRSGLTVLAASVARRAPDAVVVARADDAVAIVPVDGRHRGARALIDECAAEVDERRLGPLAAGIGNPASIKTGLQRSYAESRSALATCERLGDYGGVVAFGELGIRQLFLSVTDPADLREFADQVLGALVDTQGEKAAAESRATVLAYFEENGSLQRAARRLHVHPNTVTYRIRRFEETTGLSLSVHRDKLMIEVAMEILAAMEEGS